MSDLQFTDAQKWSKETRLAEHTQSHPSWYKWLVFKVIKIKPGFAAVTPIGVLEKIYQEWNQVNDWLESSSR